MMNDRADYLKFLIDNKKVVVIPVPPKPKFKKKDLEVDPVPSKFNVPTDLKNKQVVFSGTLKRMGRKQATDLVEQCGGHVVDAMRRGTQYLIVPDNFKHNTNKSEQAKNYGVEVMTENVFLAILKLNKLWNS